MPLNHVDLGRLDVFPGGTFNTLVDRAIAQPTPVFQPAGVAKRGKAIECQNVSGMEIPVGGILRLTGSVRCANSLIVKVNQPNASYNVLFGVALDPIAAGGLGPCTLFDPCLALYDTGDGTPAIGESWGPVAGQWSLGKNRPGFGIIGNPADERVVVTQTPWIGWARHIQFALTAELEASDNSVNCSVHDFYDGVNPANGFGGTPKVWNSHNYFAGPSGTKGGASFDPETGKYWIDWLTVDEVFRATLTEDLDSGSTADATLAVGGTTITVTDWSFIKAGFKIEDGARVFVKREGDTYYLMEASKCAVKQ